METHTLLNKPLITQINVGEDEEPLELSYIPHGNKKGYTLLWKTVWQFLNVERHRRYVSRYLPKINEDVGPAAKRMNY